MSNAKLLTLLAAILVILLGAIAWEIREIGPYAGMGVGIMLAPAAFVISLMVGIACGMRKP